MNAITRIVVLLLAAWCSNSIAQAYPTKPIRTVVPYPAGGYYDTIGRVIGQKLSRSLGQPVIVENRAGANAIIGAEFTAKSAPDGYTIMVGGIGPHGINPGLYKKLPYDAVRDFAPIIHISNQANVLVVHPSSKFHLVQELVAGARAKPRTVTFASYGAGSSPHLSAVLFAGIMGIELVHVPYKGAAPANAAMLAGETDHLFGGSAELLPHIRSGKLRALAITGTKRLPVLSDVPTMIEAGVSNYGVSSWFGYFAPAATPNEIVNRLNFEINKAMQEPDAREPLRQQGTAELVGGTPEQFADFVKAEIAKWAKIVKDSGVSVD